MDLFDIIGPVMIGPSSSHTAGAVRIGRIVRRLLMEPAVEATVFFHGSFAATWKGHGTDRAIVGGLLDMDVGDARIRDSLQIADAEGLCCRFCTRNMRDAHPNTVLIDAKGSQKSVRVQAASVGGGAIRVESIDGLKVQFSGRENTLIIFHLDVRGVIAQATGIVSRAGVNIATMHVFRKSPGADAIMVLELDMLPEADALAPLSQIPAIRRYALLERNG